MNTILPDFLNNFSWFLNGFLAAMCYVFKSDADTNQKLFLDELVKRKDVEVTNDKP